MQCAPWRVAGRISEMGIVQEGGVLDEARRRKPAVSPLNRRHKKTVRHPRGYRTDMRLSQQHEKR
jgi:hypothetical protein